LCLKLSIAVVWNGRNKRVLPSPSAVVKASVHGRRTTRARSRTRGGSSTTAHLASHMRWDVRTGCRLLVAKAEIAHVELIRHLGLFLVVGVDD
jgi:hypothetical protein